MIRSLSIDRDGNKYTDLTAAQIHQSVQDPQRLTWISVEQPTHEEALSILQDLFHFHPLAIEDCLNTGYQTPKVDDFGSYIFTIAHAIHYHDDFTLVTTQELNCFLGANYLVTIYLDEIMLPVAQLWDVLQKDERLSHNGVDFLFHKLLDYLVDAYMPLIDQLDDQIGWLEDRLLAQPSRELLEKILSLKHTLMSLRRILSPQRELMNRLSRDNFPMINPQSKIYFRDIYDHMVRFQDLVESLRDIVSGAMDIYLNSTSLRLNEVMKALTIVSTIFLPLSFVTGMFGMNFTQMWPQWDWSYGFVFFWVITILIAGGMLTFFKNRGWF